MQPIGIGEMGADEGIRMYPNPANNMLHIDNISGEKLTLSIYSITGQIMIERNIAEGSETINLESMQPGIYFVRYITDSQKVNTAKLIIQ